MLSINSLKYHSLLWNHKVYIYISGGNINMKKVKEFIEEHKMKIAGVIACGVSCGIGVYVGYSYCMRDITVLGDGIIQF